ncbi:hypothetical protein T484DRAFT_1611851, partial [Baffinella frigidus]
TLHQVGSTGVGALTLAFIILLVCTLVFVQKSQAAANKSVAYLSIYICGFAAMSYFAMLSGQGWTTVAGCRQFFYARYLDWAITFPLMTLLLGVVAGVDMVCIFGAIGAQEIQLFAQYIGAISTVMSVKWMWFLISLTALAGAVYHIVQVFKASADAKGGEVAALYGKVAWLAAGLWCMYPVVWLFSEGFASFSVSFEITAYAILDVCMKYPPPNL